LEKKAISLADLAAAMSNRFRADTNLPVYISGDHDTLHGSMADVYEVVRRAGVQKIAFAVGSEEQKLGSP
jgi:biopolymer transport protein ExbD